MHTQLSETANFAHDIVYVYMYEYMYMSIYKYANVYIYTYINTYIHILYRGQISAFRLIACASVGEIEKNKKSKSL